MIKINGVPKEFTESVSISRLLEDEGFLAPHVVVEVNEVIIKRNDYNTVMTADGDIVEILKFVGGG